MIQRLVLGSLILAVAACNGPNKPSQPGMLTSLLITGQTSYGSINQSGQLTVSGIFSNGSRQDITSQVTWIVQNPSIVTVSNTGAVRTVGYGSSSVTATLQPASASVTIQVAAPQTGLTISSTSVNLGATGETAQLTLTASFADGSTKDVSGDAFWSSDTTQVASVTAGRVTATGLGFARITGRYPANGPTSNNRYASVVVTPPGTFVVDGRTRDPGAGSLSGVTVVHQATGQTTTSVNGGFTLGGLTGGVLTLDRSGYETALVDVGPVTGESLKFLDVPLQPVTRIAAGASVTRTIAPHDMDYLLGGVHCYPCQMVRVTIPASSTLHLDAAWTETRTKLSMWINGVHFPGANFGPSSVAADVVVAPGELVVYVGQVSNQSANYVTVTLTTAMK